MNLRTYEIIYTDTSEEGGKDYSVITSAKWADDAVAELKKNDGGFQRGTKVIKSVEDITGD